MYKKSTASEISQINLFLKHKATSNYYGIPFKFLVQSANNVSSWLSEFYYQCIAKREFSSPLKNFEITHFPKITILQSANHNMQYFNPFPNYLENLFAADCTLVSSNCILSGQPFGSHNHSVELTIVVYFKNCVTMRYMR